MKGSEIVPQDKEFDPWKLETGFATSYRGTIEDPFYTTDSDYNDGQDLLLKLEILTDDPDIGDGGRTTEQYTCGKGWEAAEKGARAKREDGKKKGFNENSGVGLLVKAALACGAAEVLRSRAANDVGPLDASIWKGLTFDFERKEFTGKIDGEERSWYRMLPVKFVGEGRGVSGGGDSSPKKETPAKEEKASSGSNGSSGIDAALRAKLLARAKKSDSHDAFIELAYSELDIAGNQAAEDAVMDADGIYAEAHA